MGLGIIPGTGWSASDIKTIARETEGGGFEAIFATEVNTDVLATAQLMGEATTRIKVGSWVANIYLRHSYLCAKGASLISDATGGHMVLGLGVSHQPVNRALGIDMPSPIKALRQRHRRIARHRPRQSRPLHYPPILSASVAR